MKADLIWCTFYESRCTVNETFADENPTLCHHCNSGKIKSKKVYYKRIEG